MGTLVLLGLCSVGAGASEAVTKKPTLREPAGRASAKTTSRPATKTPPYLAARSLTGKATAARARVLASARETAEARLPRYKTGAAGDLVPDVRAAASIIFDPDSGEVLWEENSQSQRSIASITKVMTAAVLLETNPDVTRVVSVERDDVLHARLSRLRTNDRLTVDDLLHLLLIASDNGAARVLARASDFGSEGFVARMNEKAIELGLQSTSFVDPAGLLSENVSSAYDMARLIAYASSDERIASIMRTREYTLYTENHRVLTFHSTNHLLGRDDVDVRAGKTGFISRAGYCLATLLRLPNGGRQVAVVVLGARSNAGRFMETRNLFNWMLTRAPAVFATQTPLGR
jgi:D-alanyl-D-alanine endopeptidase (penicillin-binding protein 7)